MGSIGSGEGSLVSAVLMLTATKNHLIICCSRRFLHQFYLMNEKKINNYVSCVMVQENKR